MINSLKMDFARLVISKTYLIFAVIVSAIAPAVQIIILGALERVLGDTPVCTASDFMSYSLTAAVYMGIVVTAFINSEVGEGILRNKIIAGKSRAEIFLSYCFVMVTYSVILQTVSALAVFGAASISGMQFAIDSWTGIVIMIIIFIFAGASVTVFLTMLYCVFCFAKVAMIIPTLFAAISRLGLMYMFDKLFPEGGECLLTGFKLSLFIFIDRYVPFSYLLLAPHHDVLSYVIGCVGLTVISVVLGICVFNKIDVK